MSRDILQARYSSLLSEELGVTLESANDGHVTPIDPQLIAAMSNRPIVLLGDVGAGKTIFIQNLIHVEGREVFKNALTLYIDFGSEPTFADDLASHASRAIESQLLGLGVDIEEDSFVSAVLRAEISRFDKTVFGQLKEIDAKSYTVERVKHIAALVADREHYLPKALNHLVKGRRQQVVIFLDNIDQRPIEFQEKVYLIAQSMAENWPVTCFVSLRPSTFYASKRSGALAAYQPRTFTIAPPRIDLVLERRLEFVEQKLSANMALGGLPEGVFFHSSSLNAYIKALLHSFAHNRDLVELIDNLAGGNVRRALEFVRTFVGSGHVDTEKIIQIVEKTGRYTIPIHRSEERRVGKECA